MATFNISRGMFLLLVFLWLIWPGSQQMMGRATENNDSHPRRTKAKGACGNIDIRNKVQNFVVLENCTVIEGQLQILLIDYANPKDYENLSFPDLVEITDYLLLYRVFGLKSLRNIFPNLAVIRGDKLFSNYALIAFEMPNLEELGLVKLNTITRGAVRLEKNPNLCYIETVDWSKIAKGIEASEHFFKNNKDIKECINTCPVNCPATSDGVRRCWTLEHCQTMLDCPNDCEYCNEGTCCNKNCIGGCTGPKDTDCTACRNVLDAVRPNCAERCSPGTYKFMNRRCLLDTECLNFTDYPLTFKLVNSTPSNNQQKECVLECPPKYIPDKNNISLCVPCVGKCPRVCNGKVIDSINSAQALEGCTIINGPLEINIMGGSSVGQELENNLAEIEVVTQYIRIYRSHALLSLHFFKNLREIQGKELWTDRYALTVFENSNLQELFTEEVTKNLKILNGSVWFHYNSKLCIKKIKLLLEPLNLLSNVSDMDVSPTTNGDQMPCEMQKLDLNVNPAMAQLAMLHWTPYHTADERQLISYTIYYKEAPERNVAIYQGRDACSSDLWRTIEEKPKPTDLSNNAVITSLLPNLKPWTQYVVYVQTLTISNAQEGGITPLVYFRTAPDIPTYPINLKVSSEMAGELRVTWDPPSSPNGNVTHYEVYWQKQDIDAAKYDVRDYCTNPLVDSNKGQKGREDKKDENKQNQTTSGCCECPKTKKELAIEEREREMEIKFQDYLQNEVYIKRLEWPASTIQPTKAQMTLKLFGASIGNTSSYRIQPTEVVNTSLTIDIPINRTSSSTPPPTTTEKRSSVSSHTESTPTPSNATTPQPKENPYYKAVVYKKREMHIGNLGHFEDYSIEVIACHERDQVNKHKLCSNRAIITGRTLPNETADSINMSTVNHTVSTNRTGEVMIQWSDPPHPNGLILTYEIEYSRANIKNIKPNIICIPHKMYQMHGGHTLDKLELGFNYTFRIRAMSLAGNGSWTEPMFFFLPPGEVPGSQVTIIAIVISVLLIVVALIVGGVWCWFKRRFSKVPNTYISPNPDYFPNYDVYVADEWEVDRDKVRLIRELGQGSFGMVYEGIISDLNGQEVKIAIKTVNDSATDYERLMFLKEASIMKAFECHHVVRLIGVVSKTPPSLVLMELMSNDLKNFLRMHRPDEEDNEGRLPPTLKRILQMAGQIADGMAYLADKKYVHRDLAARNCMVAENLTVKIGDFGMTRDIYETDYYRKGNRGLLPVRWMAPESLRDGVFTSMSDVWSFGVVLWEMATLAAQPYQGLSNEEVLRYVGNGKIMEKPEGCPEKLYDLMLKCWRFKPKQRPTFKEIIEILVPDLDPSFRDVSYFFKEGQLKSDEMKHIDLNDIDNEDYPHPMEGELDDSNLPFLSEVANNSQDQGVELDDLFHDTGYPWQPDHSNVGAEPCDCTLIQERDQASGGISHHIISATRNSNSASPNSAIGAMDSGSSTEGSKDSSKSSSSSYALMNGLSVANGHLPIQVRTTPC